MRTSVAAFRSQAGMALPMAIVFTAMCVTIISGLLTYVVSDFKANHADWRRVQALYCAEAGVEKACETLRLSPTATAVAETSLHTDVSGADGTYEVTIAPLTNDPLGSKKITATGYVPSKSNAAASRTLVTTYTRQMWDFGSDAVRAREGIEYGSNDVMTCIVDENYQKITDTTVDASMRVTGYGASVGAVEATVGTGANVATVAGSVWAPGFVDVPTANARYISEGSPLNYMPNAFPPGSLMATWDGDGKMIWPPADGSWAEMYYRDGLVGGTSYSSSGSFTGSNFIDLGGTGTLSNATLTGPGTVFVRGNLGGNVTNGSPPVTLVVSGNFYTGGSDYYRFNAGTSTTPPPSLIMFGRDAEIAGNSNWYLNGPLIALNPRAQVLINDSAIGCFGVVISNGTVKFKSDKGAVAYPRFLGGRKFVMQGLPMVVSYSAR